ncbi:MAG: hypothetical protein ACQEWU_04030 [Bacillota bacterium]|uniref:hypothetical protein n=1 Tax=unclassified Virgibacillus TaxID=2620237 RepID=UPI000EF46AF0|nr:MULTISPECIES: hypothetical protein [unclassified Virgibacillus]MCC2249299.1 hypothetical protein [Virgibacillus sp. AGTR]MDY7043875.1 hypothetical protein [Virgibacillus sp. M23]QRZ17332.1 hypothetical protein JUJ52_16370 [Virgibacillus sp. AGTR]
MSLRISGDQQVNTSNHIAPLKKGQIIQGRVLKLFPGNKAQIQIGQHKMIAQLQASLHAGGNYYFQVVENDQVLELKVLGERSSTQVGKTALQLLEQLGLKQTKTNMVFLQELMRDQIPFDKSQLSQAFQLLVGKKGNQQELSIIKEMIRNRWPISNAVFQALVTKDSHSLSKQLLEVFQQLPGQVNHSQLKQQIALLLQPFSDQAYPNMQIKSMVPNRQVIPLLHILGLTQPTIDKTNGIMSNASATTNGSGSAQQQAVTGLWTGIKGNRLSEVIANKADYIARTESLVSVLQDKIYPVTGKQHFGTSDIQQIKQLIKDTFPNVSHLSSLHTKSDLQRFIVNLKLLQRNETYTQLEQLLLNGKNQTNLGSKDHFLSAIRQTIQWLGLTYEHTVANEKVQQPTLKGMLINMFTQNEGILHERAKQLLHHINALQLQSVQESDNFIQAYLQVPGNKMGLKGDAELLFEGKKTTNGEFDPDHCRILFDLELMYLKRTVIDMHIQNRTVAITVFNNNKRIKELLGSLKPSLQNGLDSLDYQLSTIIHKPLQAEKEPKEKLSVTTTYQGVDYKI